jgi:hypothetical protein
LGGGASSRYYQDYITHFHKSSRPGIKLEI